VFLIEVSATGRSLVQRSPTECVCVFVSLCVIGATVIDYTCTTQVEEVRLRKKERKKGIF